ncbi:hypothetical protein EDC01DRAFT_788312 [Geopyxis carbonaria]|nr:hypothetical protein EDC01DRAFT_788312 [Geopyxis carbonaria]
MTMEQRTQRTILLGGNEQQPASPLPPLLPHEPERVYHSPTNSAAPQQYQSPSNSAATQQYQSPTHAPGQPQQYQSPPHPPPPPPPAQPPSTTTTTNSKKRPATDDAMLPNKPVRKRAPTACNSCRTRKTKCDGTKPICGGCLKLGVECVGNDDKELSLYESTNLRILEGIDRLERILLTSGGGSGSNREQSVTSPAMSTVTAIAATTPAATTAHTLMSIDGASTDGVTFSGVRAPGMLDRVLSWPVFARPSRPAITFGVPSLRSPAAVVQPPQPPLLDPDIVRDLHDAYIARVHVCYPILDADELGAMVAGFADGRREWGWDGQACLVLLVCALGAVSEDYWEHVRTAGAVDEASLKRVRRQRGEVAGGYWSMAQMRLGIVMAEVSELSVQCLCLAGFWYLYQLDCLAAYKFFHTACVTFQTLTLSPGTAAAVTTDGGSPMTYPQYLLQRLYWTTLKSECELRAELSLPVPTGSQLEYPLHFPAPPSPPPSHTFDDRTWYFYTAEIFLRRLHNRLIDEVSSYESGASGGGGGAGGTGDLHALITITHEFTAYITRWHASLPAAIRFDWPDAAVAPCADERQQRIRKRFLECLVLLYRPFLNLVVNGAGGAGGVGGGMGGQLGWTTVQDFAARAVRYALAALRADRGVWYCASPGTWWECRERLGAALMIRVAARVGVGGGSGGGGGGGGGMGGMGGMGGGMGAMGGGMGAEDWRGIVEEAERSVAFWCGGEGWEERGGLGDAVRCCQWARSVLEESMEEGP